MQRNKVVGLNQPRAMSGWRSVLQRSPETVPHCAVQSSCYFASALAVCAPCFLKVRVSENSPNRCPTIFSVTNTGLKILPLCTLKVRPTKSGVIIERRDQVLIGVLDFASFAFWIFSIRCPSTKGPFLIDLPIIKIGVV